MHVAVIDVGGSHGKNLGWWIAGPCRGEGKNDIDCCVDVLAAALREGPLALGFEAPLFVPQRNKPSELLKARRGECIGGVNRPFSAGAGAAVLAAALVVVPYVLSKLNTAVPHAMTVLDWRSKLSRPGQIFFFEAFERTKGAAGRTRGTWKTRGAPLMRSNGGCFGPKNLIARSTSRTVSTFLEQCSFRQDGRKTLAFFRVLAWSSKLRAADTGIHTIKSMLPNGRRRLAPRQKRLSAQRCDRPACTE